MSWTNPVSSSDTARFFRVSVNAPNPAVSTNYHSWNNVISVNNGLVEALIVPTNGRVQQFRFLGDTTGALWENSALHGQAPSGYYPNFGGDKAWPSPQSVWNWPPPKGFDGSSDTVSFTNGIVTLVTPVDSTYSIQTTRIIELLFNEPVMRIRTIFKRTATSTKTNLGVWIDCQTTITNTSRCYVPVPSPSIFPSGYTTNGSTYFTATLPAVLTNTNGVISFGSDNNTHKLGFDGGTIVLVGTNESLRVDAPRVAGATYPDGGSSTEVYTDYTNYFELELLGPMTNLSVGGQIEYDTFYSLFRRTRTHHRRRSPKNPVLALLIRRRDAVPALSPHGRVSGCPPARRPPSNSAGIHRLVANSGHVLLDAAADPGHKLGVNAAPSCCKYSNPGVCHGAPWPEGLYRCRSPRRRPPRR